ncbi:glutamate-1-semialdehyde 2,1-aminomutase [Lachnospiraceae bacterium ASD3451]|uniref:glutamate-1-semialdehyde 2,1-aminomutase n=1 Tax=Diplocloster agilis TaxID=2850323 RepID=UPI001D865F49|nr:glutamate-1-semialdehyde 2,1-aminomutase [Diplocloster agilis]MBU9744938.1 glutamate-1-semialdehyde 2,1-aminomutase [Diplocloster agilis]
MFRSEQLFERAVKVMPGGVNSPVRAYQSVGSTPRFIRRADGAYVYDVDQNRYIDYICSWGPMILGHNNMKIREAVIQASYEGLSFGAATEMEVNMAERICRLVPSMEMVRMVNSGTEAVMSAIRAARGYTGRNKIIKFEGCYHGHSDSLLVKAGSGVMTAGIPDSLGVPEGCARDTLTAVYNDCDSVARLFEENKGEVAALIVEPVAGNMGVVEPCPGFLQGLRDLCTEHGAVLIFDEVITGFRLSLQGAQGYYGITPDLTTFGKIIGGGMPVGCYGGRREIMQTIAPCGSVYQAGTLSGNPIAMAAGLEELTQLEENPDIYLRLEEMGNYFRDRLRDILKAAGKSYQVTGVGSLSCLFFAEQPVLNYQTAKTSDTAEFARYFNWMLDHHIHLAPSQFEAIFLSAAHTKKDVDETLDAAEEFFRA